MGVLSRIVASLKGKTIQSKSDKIEATIKLYKMASFMVDEICK